MYASVQSRAMAHPIAHGAPATVSANGNTAILDFRDYSTGFIYVATGADTGGSTSPTATFAVDYMDADGSTILAFGIVSLGPFTGAGATFSNIGPLAGGGGFVIPEFIRIRWTVSASAGTPVFPLTVRLFGR